MEVKSSGKKALKAGLWYTVCNVIIRGINFLTTPLFTRLMTKADYGIYANYASWLSLLTVLTTLDLASSVARAKIDYGDDLDGYISSIQCLGTIFTAVCYLVVVLFQDFFTKLFQMDMLYIHIMFLYLLVAPSFQLLQTKHRQLMKYKTVSFITMVSTLSTVVVSVLLVVSMENKVLGRVIGNTVVLLALCLVIYAYNMLKGRRVSAKDWKYALWISVPLIPHSVAGNILGTTDRIIINQYCGSEATALYSVVHSCALIISLLGSSINQAWAPWLFDMLHLKEYDTIKRSSRKYLMIAFPSVFLIMLCGPEIVYIFGGQAYAQSKYIVPSIMAGCYFWIMYTFFINVETYNKKTLGISVRTAIAAAFNLITNIIFIPRFGYEAAAYTTLASYFLMFVLHVFACLKLGAREYYDLKVFLVLSLLTFAAMFLSLVLYSINPVRYICIIALGTAGVIVVWKNKNNILKLLKRGE